MDGDTKTSALVFSVRAAELLDGGAEAALRRGDDRDGDATRKRNGLRIGRPVRRRQQDLVAGIEQCLEAVVDGVLATVGDQHLRASQA